MQAIPIAPPIPIQGGILIPEPILAQPTGQPFLWEPVPMYIEDIPQAIPTPNPGGSGETEEAEEEESEESPSKGETRE